MIDLTLIQSIYDDVDALPYPNEEEDMPDPHQCECRFCFCSTITDIEDVVCDNCNASAHQG